MVGDADDRLPLAAEPEGLVGVGGCRPGHGVGRFLGVGLRGEVDLLALLPLDVHRERELVVLVPGHLVLAHPERGDLDLVLRALVVLPLRLGFGAPHRELAGRDRDHLEFQVGAGDRLGIRLHVRGLRRRLVGPRGRAGRATADESDRRAKARVRRSVSRLVFSVGRGPGRRPVGFFDSPSGVGGSGDDSLRGPFIDRRGPGRSNADGRGSSRFEFAETHMGSAFKIVLYTPDEATARGASRSAFERIAALDASLSDYQPESELSRLCDRAGGPPVAVGDDLFFILQRSKAMYERSGGAFDVTVGPVVRLWRRARRDRKMPSAENLARARALVSSDFLTLDPEARTVRLARAGMKLDLGGIAKGYASGEAIKVLKSLGYPRALVAGAGDIVAGSSPPGPRRLDGLHRRT